MTLPAGGSATVAVTMTAVKSAAAGDHSAALVVSNGTSQVARSVLYAFVG